ncbi:Crp/Fnr family transcriptional regulator [Sinomonas mesophila]|uniref:Crp/Fnr family transcriptional regulator n=1 Tax=Sinomonas mesophila TaxID=1531955 RepID=UPI001FEBA69E|nr:Crp/Fnr family transcriptional regulator [Sinomonas mesophila]
MNQARDAQTADSLDRSPVWAPHHEESVPEMLPSPQTFTCLREVDLFADLSPEEMDAFGRMVPLRRFARGETIYSQSEPMNALFILKQGRVRIFRLAEDGKALTMAILEPGAVFGEMLLVGQRMYDNYAEAIEDSLICQLTAADVEAHLLSDPRIAVRISRLLADQVVRLEARLADLALRPLTARTASMLLELAETAPPSRFGLPPAIRLTHEQLAGLLGATREATSKAMGELASEGLIRQGRGRILVLGMRGLREAARRTS